MAKRTEAYLDRVEAQLAGRLKVGLCSTCDGKGKTYYFQRAQTCSRCKGYGELENWYEPDGSGQLKLHAVKVHKGMALRAKRRR